MWLFYYEDLIQAVDIAGWADYVDGLVAYHAQLPDLGLLRLAIFDRERWVFGPAQLDILYARRLISSYLFVRRC